MTISWLATINNITPAPPASLTRSELDPSIATSSGINSAAMTTSTASRPTPAHQLSGASIPSLSTSKTEDINFQGLRIPRGSVSAKLSFYKAPEDGSPPHNYVEPLPG